MKKSTFFKTLLLAAGLLGGSSAWAGDVSTIYSKALDGWSSDDITASSSTFTAGKWTPSQTGDGNKGLFIVADQGLMTRARQNTVTGTLTLNRTANTIVTIDAIWNAGDTRNKSDAHQNGFNQFSYFQYGDLLISICQDDRSTDYSYTINNIKTTMTASAGSLLNTDLTIHLVVNSVDGEISDFYIKNGDTELAKFSDLTDDNNTFADGTNYDQVITKAWGTVSSTNNYNYLKSITIQEETQSVATASITFKYVDTDGNDLSSVKADQVLSDVAVGTTIAPLINSTYTTTFFDGEDHKYVYANAYTVTDSYTTVQAGGNTVTLKFTDYPATDYTVKAQVGGSDLTNVATGSAFLDGSTTAFYPKYLKVSDAWYETTAPYGLAITAASMNVSYTAIDGFDYYWEAEDMTYGRTYGISSNNANYSNGKGIGIYAGNTFTSKETVTAGVYTVVGGAVVRNSSSQPYAITYSTDGETWNDASATLEFAADATTASVNVYIPEEAYIRFTESKGGNAQNYMDYFTLKKLPATISAPITSATGYATFSSTYALDFTDVTALTAYTATACDGETVTLTKVTGTVAANTGLVIKGETADIPVVAEGDAQAGNMLFALDGSYSTLNAAASGTNYVLSVQDDKAVFAPIGATGAPVTAGHAALFVPEASSAKLRLVFADELANGINGVTAVSNADAAIYNLSGQRVNAAYKGIVIKNGKKFINK